jgi:hypothetical protein
MEDLILDPSRLADVPPDKLLEAASAGYIGIDHRFLHAIVDRPEISIPALVRFAAEDHEQDPVRLDEDLVDIFRHLHAPEAIPFLVDLARRDPLNIPDDVVEALVQFGRAAVDPVLGLLEELDKAGEDEGDVPFLLSQLRVRDPRILEALTERLDEGDPEAALLLDMYGDPAGIPRSKQRLRVLRRRISTPSESRGLSKIFHRVARVLKSKKNRSTCGRVTRRAIRLRSNFWTTKRESRCSRAAQPS